MQNKKDGKTVSCVRRLVGKHPIRRVEGKDGFARCRYSVLLQSGEAVLCVC